MNSNASQQQADFILQARLDLVRTVCEELRNGQSPFPRLHRAQKSLEQDDGSQYRQEEIRFVESILGRLVVGAPENNPPPVLALAGSYSSFGSDFS